jgi:hypothetical protein
MKQNGELYFDVCKISYLAKKTDAVSNQPFLELNVKVRILHFKYLLQKSVGNVKKYITKATT